jgi:AMP deaminase
VAKLKRDNPKGKRCIGIAHAHIPLIHTNVLSCLTNLHVNSVSIYGRDKNEWSKLAGWMVDNDIFSDHLSWMVQVPRL